MRKTASFLLLVMLLLLSSCKNSSPDEMPDLGGNTDNLKLNVSIQLSVPKECNTYQAGKPVCLEVTNLSRKVWNYNIQRDILIFQYENKKWSKVPDKMVNLGKTDMSLSPAGSFPDDNEIVHVLPGVETSKPLFLRIYVIVHEQALGDVTRSEGAYVDLNLKP